MPPLPPWKEVWDVLHLLLAPAIGASLLVMLVLRAVMGERFSAVAAAVAVGVGVFVGNYFREAMEWRIDSERPLSAADLRTVLGWSLEGKPTPVEKTENSENMEPVEEPPPLPPARYWLPWLAGFAMLIDVLMRLPGIPNTVGWVARTLVAVLAGRLLTPADLRVEIPWASWALCGAILLQWTVFHLLAQRWKDGTVAVATALCFSAAGVVLLYAHSARLTDMALLFFAALMGPALIGWCWRCDMGGALAGAAVFLPGLLLNGQQVTFSDVPWTSFLLAGLAPLAFIPLFLPILVRQERWRRWLPGVILPLIAATVAVALAARAETLQF